MIPYLLAVVGGYLIGDSVGKQVDEKVQSVIPEMAEGGLSDQLQKVRQQRDKKGRYTPDIPIYLIQETKGRIVFPLPILTEIRFSEWENAIKKYVREAKELVKVDKDGVFFKGKENKFIDFVDKQLQNPYNINSYGNWYHINNKLEHRGKSFNMRDALKLATKIVFENPNIKAIVLPSNLATFNFIYQEDFDINTLTTLKDDDSSELATVPKYYMVYVSEDLPIEVQKKYENAYADGGMMAHGGLMDGDYYLYSVVFTNGEDSSEDINRRVIAKNEDDALGLALQNKLTKYGDSDYTVKGIYRLKRMSADDKDWMNPNYFGNKM